MQQCEKENNLFKSLFIMSFVALSERQKPFQGEFSCKTETISLLPTHSSNSADDASPVLAPLMPKWRGAAAVKILARKRRTPDAARRDDHFLKTPSAKNK